mmetsp:Transcript_66312/g.106852  ORF Transcript_66312/g.106852 Transcript_66312/m.106852 type:complete len:82 (-) Transcript_66312:38-283(-)
MAQLCRLKAEQAVLVLWGILWIFFSKSDQRVSQQQTWLHLWQVCQWRRNRKTNRVCMLAPHSSKGADHSVILMSAAGREEQ